MFNSSQIKDVRFLFEISFSIEKANLYSECLSENNCRKGRSSLRQIQSNKSAEQNSNEDKIEYLLKEQLNRLMKRQTTTVQPKRTVIKIPSVDIKHQYLSHKPVQQQTDTTSINDRYAKLQQFIYSPVSNCQRNDLQRQSPLFLQQITTLGLTITPLEIYNSNQQQSDKSIRRPSTQSGVILFIFTACRLSLCFRIQSN